AQTRFAEQLQREGWFDRGWEIDAGLHGKDRWFPERVVVGNHPWSSAAWSKALAMWRDHGKRNGTLLDADQLKALEEQARLYREPYGVSPRHLDPKLRPEDFDGEMRKSFEAHYQYVWYHNLRDLTNFPTFVAQARGESDPEAIAARELFFQAIRKRKADAP